MKTNTYGIRGLNEWHGAIKAGEISVKVSFVGGTSSPSGSQPAYYMTKDPIVQFVIENSKEFKSGFITLEMSQDTPGDHPRMAKANEEKPASNAPAASDSDSEESESEEPIAEGNGSATIVNVADKNEAIEYLKEHFGSEYTSTRLRSKTAFDAACEECGVQFIYGE